MTAHDHPAFDPSCLWCDLARDEVENALVTGQERLTPAESVALTVALAQVLRGEEPTPNVATVCVLALARLTDRHDYAEPSP